MLNKTYKKFSFSVRARLFAFSAVLAVSAIGCVSDHSVLVDDFASGSGTNLLGASAGVWESDPDAQSGRVSAEAVLDKREGKDVKVLEIDYSVTPGYFNGYFTRLNGLDGRLYEEIGFYARGGDEYPDRFRIELKNTKGESGHLYISGIEKEWKKIYLPFEYFEGIRDLSELHELVIVIEGDILGEHEGTLFIDDIMFTGDRRRYLSVSEEIRNATLKHRRDISRLIDLEDDALLEVISRKIFDYFWSETGRGTGFVRDRSRKDAPSSIAATGFGLAAVCIGAERGWIARGAAKDRVQLILESTLKKAEGHRGFYYHFIDPETGRRAWQSELSSIDTALLLGGVITASEYFNDPEISALAREMYLAVEWPWMMEAETKALYMGWDPENGFKEYPLWDMFGEQMMMYILGLGSPTHPLPEESWHSFRRPVRSYEGLTYIYEGAEALFVYLFSHAFIDFRDKHDDYADYWINSRDAAKAHIAFCRNNQLGLRAFKEGLWGVSASDGPDGYRHYGATVFTTDGTIAPYASAGSVALVPEQAIKNVRQMLSDHGTSVWEDRYGFVSAFNLDRDWFSSEQIGIDIGIMLLMIENYRSGFVWEYFMRNEHIQRGMKRTGFREGTKALVYDPSEADELFEGVSYSIGRAGSHDFGADDFIELDPAAMLEFGEIRNERDLSARFALGWNEEHLLVTVDVTDDVVIARTPPELIYQHDCIELFISPGMMLDWGNPEHFQIGISPTGPQREPQKYAFFQREDPGAAVKVESELTDGGYRINASVSWEYLGITPQEGRSFGLSVAVHDVDSPTREGAGGKKLNWSFRQTPAGIILAEVTLR